MKMTQGKKTNTQPRAPQFISFSLLLKANFCLSCQVSFKLWLSNSGIEQVSVETHIVKLRIRLSIISKKDKNEIENEVEPRRYNRLRRQLQDEALSTEVARNRCNSLPAF